MLHLVLRAIVLVALACSGQKTVPPVVGFTRETAIAVPLTLDASVVPPELARKLEPTAASRAPRWFVVTLPANEKRTLSASVSYSGAARSVDIDLLDPAGKVLAHGTAGSDNPYDHYGWRSAWLAEVQGAYFIRVTTHDGAKDYVLDISSTVVTPRPKDWEPCNPFVYDPENPRCRGVVACDPNKPMTTNPSCCEVGCVRGECTGTLSRITAEDGYAWFSGGATAGITTWYNGEAELTFIGGARARVHIRVVEVERERSKVLLSVYERLDLSRFDGRVARLKTPAVCGNE